MADGDGPRSEVVPWSSKLFSDSNAESDLESSRCGEGPRPRGSLQHVSEMVQVPYAWIW